MHYRSLPAVSFSRLDAVKAIETLLGMQLETPSVGESAWLIRDFTHQPGPISVSSINQARLTGFSRTTAAHPDTVCGSRQSNHEALKSADCGHRVADR